MRYCNPITFIKHVPATGTDMAYTKTLVSFQSTGSTNIAGVNNLPSVSLYMQAKTRGRGDQKRQWGIEMNEGRQTYLSFYFGVDNIDHMIKNALIRFISWKYWHTPYSHFFCTLNAARDNSIPVGSLKKKIGLHSQPFARNFPSRCLRTTCGRVNTPVMLGFAGVLKSTLVDAAVEVVQVVNGGSTARG